jgi:hypothetical protein
LSGLFAFLVGRTQWRQLPEKTMQPNHFGDAGVGERWEAHLRMEREAQAKAGIMSQAQCQIAPQMKSTGNQERAPVHASIARLIELVSVLDKQSEALTDRLMPVSRPGMCGAGENSEPAQEPQCSLDDELIVLSGRIQFVIDRINGARHRLCI